MAATFFVSFCCTLGFMIASVVILRGVLDHRLGYGVRLNYCRDHRWRAIHRICAQLFDDHYYTSVGGGLGISCTLPSLVGVVTIRFETDFGYNSFFSNWLRWCGPCIMQYPDRGQRTWDSRAPCIVMVSYFFSCVTLFFFPHFLISCGMEHRL